MAGTAALLSRRDYDTLAVRREVTSPGGTTARGLAALERGGLRPRLPGGDRRGHRRSGTALMLAAAVTRGDIANYVQALFIVYILLIFVYILLNMMFSLGLRPPYSRWPTRSWASCATSASRTCGSSAGSSRRSGRSTSPR